MSTIQIAPENLSMAELRDKAVYLNIEPGQMPKTGLIHAIQTAEANAACFATAAADQCQHNTDCCFSEDCLKTTLAECRQTVESLQQRINELMSENQQLQQQIAEHVSVCNELKQCRDQLRYRLEEQTIELAKVSDKLQQETVGHQRLEGELQDYHDHVEQHLVEDGDRCTAAGEKLESEIATRRRVEEKVAQLERELENANFIIQKQVELNRGKTKLRKRTTYGLVPLARVCGRIAGFMASAFCR